MNKYYTCKLFIGKLPYTRASLTDLAADSANFADLARLRAHARPDIGVIVYIVYTLYNW